MRPGPGLAAPLFGLALALWSASPSAAQEDSSEYRAVVSLAVGELNAGRYDEALAQFLRAHALQPSARTRRGIGLAAYALGDYVRACDALQASLADSRNPLTDAQRAESEALLRQAEQYVARLRVITSPPDATLTREGEPLARDAEGWTRLNPGTHQLVASAPGYRDEARSVTLRAAQEESIHLTLTASQAERPEGVGPTVTPATSAPPSSDGFPVTPAAISFAIAGAAAIALAVSGAIALDLDASVATDCGDQAGSVCLEEDLAELRAAVLAADVSLGVMAATLALGVAFVVASAATAPGSRDAAVAPWVAPDGAGVVVHGRL